MIKKSLWLGVVASLSLGGCATVEVNPRDLDNRVQLPLSVTNPSPGGAVTSKVVIFEVDTSNAKVAKESEAGSSIQFALDGYINEAGAELVDRNLAAKLKDEVIRAEMGGAGAYQGAPVADYAVRTTVTGASFGAEFKEASRWTDDDGKTHVTPASCNYASRVGLSVDVYTVPELKRVKSLRGTGSTSASEDARNSNCSKGGPSLVRRAAEDAVYEIQEELKAFLAPTGYVLHGFETAEGKYILKTTLTKAIGAKEGKGVRIINVTEEGDRYPIGEGKIATPLVQSGAFVVVDEETISRVRIGDEVRVDHSCSIMGCKLDQTLGMK
ncbi:hypothetical protein [Marinobacter similis]|uniref:Curli production assembly/transport component CsgG n=1 Tax=Marinobacter similis TaxID=1420916 RepID=W5YUG4_9GAMM|nr:hypothetical protein [Marinobacter similis]AHI30128.1 hypothetical protein AU14_12570 [Marinobacter similis]